MYCNIAQEINIAVLTPELWEMLLGNKSLFATHFKQFLYL